MAPKPRRPTFYLDLAQRSQKVIVASVITGIIAGVSSTGLIALINQVANAGLQEHFAVLLSGFAALILIRLVSSVLAKVMLIRLAQDIICKLRLALSRQILVAPLGQFEQIGIPRLMAALTDDIVTLSETFGAIPILCIDLSVIIACLVYLGWLSPRLLLMTLLFVSVGVASYRWLANKGLRRLTLARQQEDILFEHLRTMTSGFKELKLNANRQAEFFHDYLNSSVEAYKNLNIGALQIFALADGWGEMLFFIPVGLALFLFPSIGAVPQQALWGYVITIIYMIGPLSNIVNLLPGIGRSYVAAHNINVLENALASGIEPSGAVGMDKIESEAGWRELKLMGVCHLENALASGVEPSGAVGMDKVGSEAGWRELKLMGVCHSYPGSGQETGFTIGPIDLNLYPGEILFVTGGNGSGKSTLAKLITGLYSAETGDIVLDGTRVQATNQTWYRQHFSAILADYYVFERLMGIDPNQAAAKTEAYLCWLGLNHKVAFINGGFSTTKLSSGQRRRLAMLTALLEDRPIHVFDEWAADQDAEFRQMFYAELLPTLKARGKGIVVISHDERYFSAADRIIKLEYGKMVAGALQPMATA